MGHDDPKQDWEVRARTDAQGEILTPLLDRLRREAKSNTAAATVLANELLLCWRAGQADISAVDEARQLLEFAAGQGDPQACYMLASEGSIPLCDDSESKKRHLDWAARCGHHAAMELENDRHNQRECEQEAAADGWEADLDDRLRWAEETIQRCQAEAAAGDPGAQYELGMALLQKQEVLSELSDTEWDSEVVDQAMGQIKASEPYVPYARFILGQEEKDLQRAIELLRSAAFPPSPQVPYDDALLSLASRLAEAGDVRGAAEALRESIARGLPSAERDLARLIDEHGPEIGASPEEARSLYLRCYTGGRLHGVHAYLRAGVMCLRGEGGPQDINLAGELFDRASRQPGSQKMRDYAALARALGWEGWDAGPFAVELLIRLLAANGFQAENSPVIRIEDVEALLSGNADFRLFAELTHDIRNSANEQRGEGPLESEIKRIDALGHRREIDFKVLILTLSSLLLRRGGEEVHLNVIRGDHYLQRHSMAANYVLAGIAGSGRVPSSYSRHVRKHLERTEDLAQVVALRIPLGPNGLRAYEFYVWLRAKAQSDLQAWSEKEIEDARHAAERDMLSYLTHTLNNLMASAPETASQALRLLGTEVNRNGKAINNIATMFSTFLFAQKLLTTFKLYIADPASLRKNWADDNGGNSSVSIVMAFALRQTLSQIVFASNNQSKLQRLLQQEESGAIKNIRKSFIEEIIPLDIDAVNASKVLRWVAEHMPALKIDIDPESECHFNGNSTRFTFFFAGFSELIYNALKYSDGSAPVEIWWRKEGNEYVFRSTNAWSEESLATSEGVQRGLGFLTHLVEMLGASLVQESDGHCFKVEIRLPTALIESDT